MNFVCTVWFAEWSIFESMTFIFIKVFIAKKNQKPRVENKIHTLLYLLLSDSHSGVACCLHYCIQKEAVVLLRHSCANCSTGSCVFHRGKQTFGTEIGLQSVPFSDIVFPV